MMETKSSYPIGNYTATQRVITQLVYNTEANPGQRCTLGIGTPGAIAKARFEHFTGVGLFGCNLEYVQLT
jgi:hypothetical protein